MFEVGVARDFHATHQLVEPETGGAPHGHDYRAEVLVRGDALDANGMLVDIDVLRAAVETCVAELESVQLESIEAFTGVSTTVESVAQHLWRHVCELIGPPVAAASIRVTIHESGDAWASFDRPVDR